MANTALEKRRERLMPSGIPRYVRCYDDGGKSIDRYTVVFAKKPIVDDERGKSFMYLAMNAAPFHPQGFGQHGETNDSPCDTRDGRWPPAIGRTNHLGKRIPFEALPEDCRTLVLSDYRDLWELNDPA